MIVTKEIRFRTILIFTQTFEIIPTQCKFTFVSCDLFCYHSLFSSLSSEYDSVSTVGTTLSLHKLIQVSTKTLDSDLLWIDLLNWMYHFPWTLCESLIFSRRTFYIILCLTPCRVYRTKSYLVSDRGFTGIGVKFLKPWWYSILRTVLVVTEC